MDSFAFGLLFVLFPINGLFVVFLWALTMCNLIQVYIATKNKDYLTGLAALCFVNAFYIPTVLHYMFFEYLAINIPFWVGNLIAAIVIAISARKKCRIGRFKSLILFAICLIPASKIMIGDNSDWFIGALYIIAAVVVFPICYYVYARKKFSENPGLQNSKGNGPINSDES